MSYQALYRTYRPTKFSDVVGQKHIIKTLKNAVMEDRVMHAYIFSGPRGIGKTTIARILAKAVNCEDTYLGEPCLECNSCRAIINEETTDIVELDAASNNGVDEMRDILEKVNFLPSRLRKKVYIIDEAHMLSTSAFNALLKTLEEPPSHVIFILATTEPYKIPATILSRCQRFDFQQLTVKEIKEQLRKIADIENIKISDDALTGVAEAAEGGMRDAFSILDQVSIYNIDSITEEDVESVTGKVSDQKMINLITNLYNEDVANTLSLCEEILESGKEANSIINGIIKFSRALLLYKNGALEDDKKIYKNQDFIDLANIISESKLFYYIDIMIDTQNKMRYVNSPKIFLEIGLLKIVDSATEDLNVLKKIKSLEEKLLSIPTNGVAINEVENENNYDNKIKRLNNTLEKYDIPGYKEYVNAKISMLEEVTSKFATIPDDVSYRLEQLEENEKMKQVSEVALPVVNVDYELINTKIDEKINSSLPTINNVDIDAKIDEKLKSLVIPVKENNNENTNISNDVFTQLMDLIDQTNDNIYKMDDKFAKQIEDINNKDKESDSDVIDNLENKTTEIQTNVDELKTNFVELETKINDDINSVKVEFVSQTAFSEVKEQVTKLKEYNDKLIDKIESLEKQLAEKTEVKEEIRKRRSPFEFDRDENVTSNEDKPKQETFALSENKEQVEKEPELVEKPKNNSYTYQTPEKEVKATDTTVVIRTQPAYQQVNKNDETAKVFDAKIVEKILHEAREKECREERNSLIANWNRLDEKVGNLLAPIAKILMDGKLTANGHNGLLIVYPNAIICNNLMSPKTHSNAKQILKITFGKDYDFMALPENTWQQKRLEYAGQFNMGNKFPKLSPINNPELKVLVTNVEAITSRKSNGYQTAEKLFGPEFVEKENN